jgi:putative hydrolase of the HAD superfamily
MDGMNIDAVIFDWGGTLTPWHTVDPFECWLAVTQDEIQAKALRAAEDAIWSAARQAHRSGTVEDLLEHAELTLTDEQLRSYYQWWDAHSYTDPEAAPMMARFREMGLKVGVLSNTIWPRVEHERIFSRDAVDQLIDGAVYSSEIPWTKPHPEAFAAAMHAVGVTDPSRAVFVGDRLFEDVYGAQQAGMRAVLLPHSTIPLNQQVGVDATPDAIIQRLSDLVPVIQAWL